MDKHVERNLYLQLNITYQQQIPSLTISSIVSVVTLVLRDEGLNIYHIANINGKQILKFQRQRLL